MKTVQANSYKQAAKSLEGLAPGLSQRISQEIRADERNHYHLVTVKIRPAKYGEVSGKVDIVVVKTYKRQFDKLATNHHYHGFSHVYLLHNPELNSPEDSIVNAPINKDLDVEAIKLEAMKEANEKIAEAQAKMEEQQRIFMQQMQEKFGLKEDTGSTDSKEVSKIKAFIAAIEEGKEIDVEDFSKQHPNQLLQFARHFKIELQGKTKKSEIMPSILSFIGLHNEGKLIK